MSRRSRTTGGTRGHSRPFIAAADFVITQPHWPLATHWLRSAKTRLIFDLYDPEPLEILEYLSDRPRMQAVIQAFTVDGISEALRIGITSCAQATNSATCGSVRC